MGEALAAVLRAGFVEEVETGLSEADAESVLGLIPAGCFGIDHLTISGVGWSRSVDFVVEDSSNIVWTAESRPSLSGPTNLVIVEGWVAELSAIKSWLRSVDVSALPASSIEAGMFQDCVVLERLRLPPSLTEIPAGLCQGCFRLADVNFCDLVNLASVGICAFQNCRRLREFTAPPCLRRIDHWAFSGTRIRRVDLSENRMEHADLEGLGFLENAIFTRRVGEFSLLGCSALRSLTGSGRWADAVPVVEELRHTSLDGRVEPLFGPSVAGARVLSELATIGGRLTRASLLP
jgi:hypothetical protein